MSLDIALLVVGVIGAIDSLLALRLSLQPVQAPAACVIGAQDDAPACPTLFQSETASLVGKTPNSLLGTLYFAGVTLLGLGSVMGFPLPSWAIAGGLIASVAATAMSVYLFWHLVFVRHERCVICFIGHACSLVSLILLGWLVVT